MAYKQKKPMFFKSALKQYYNYENEGKKEISKEEFIKLSNQGAHVGPEGKAAIDLWKSSLFGKTGIDEIDAMSKHDKQNEYSRALKKYQDLQNNLTQEEMDNAEEVSPMKATPGYAMLMAGAGGGKYNEKGRKIGAGSNYYTGGDLSYRGEYNTDLIYNPKEPKDPMKKDNSGNNEGDNGDNGGDNNSSLNFKFPKLFKDDASPEAVNYATTDCTSFGEKEIDPKTGLVKYRRSRDGKLRPVMKKRYRGGGRGIESDMW
tara:strand:- start:202 stop:978 length:777 start_codon:yes stop_codon:yes gene_type:complete